MLESNYIEKDEIVQVVYNADASDTTHNLKDSGRFHSGLHAAG